MMARSEMTALMDLDIRPNIQHTHPTPLLCAFLLVLKCNSTKTSRSKS
jgi:hypothetical protein